MQSNYNRFRIKCNGISVKCFAHASSPLFSIQEKSI
nr:MAG TPA: Protein of unknown function (DUF3718) [Caudoviricetes sp.]